MGGRAWNAYSAAVDLVQVFSNATVTVTPLAPLNSARTYPAFGTIGGDWNSDGLGVGGANPGYVAAAEVYGPGPPFSPNATLLLYTGRSHVVATSALVNSTVGMSIFAGGWNGSALAVVDLYDHADRALKSLPPLTQPRQASCAASVGPYALVIGGTSTSSSSPTPLALVDVFDVRSALRVRSAMPPCPLFLNPSRTLQLATPRWFCGAAALGPFVYVAGGLSDTGEITSVEVIDTRDWTVFPASEPLTVGGAAIGGASTPSGVFFFGGSDLNGLNETDAIHVYQCGNEVRPPFSHLLSSSLSCPLPPSSSSSSSSSTTTTNFHHLLSRSSIKAKTAT